MKTTTIELALRTDAVQERPLPERLFGEFTAPTLDGRQARFAFEAGRYPYVGTPLHLQLWVHDELPMWEPYIALTKNLRPNDCRSNEIIVKTYEENEHMRSALLALGFFEDTGERIATGFAQLEIWRVTDAFAEAFDKVHPTLEMA